MPLTDLERFLFPETNNVSRRRCYSISDCLSCSLLTQVNMPVIGGFVSGSIQPTNHQSECLWMITTQQWIQASWENSLKLAACKAVLQQNTIDCGIIVRNRNSFGSKCNFILFILQCVSKNQTCYNGLRYDYICSLNLFRHVMYQYHCKISQRHWSMVSMCK